MEAELRFEETMKLAMVQPTAHRAPDDEQNVDDAVAHIAAAAAAGADFVVFPETYPVPSPRLCGSIPSQRCSRPPAATGCTSSTERSSW